MPHLKRLKDNNLSQPPCGSCHLDDRQFGLRRRAIWPELRAELTEFPVPVAVMHDALAASGGPTTAAQLGLDVDFYREAVCHAREIRKRYSALDLAADAGLLEAFAAGEGGRA